MTSAGIDDGDLVLIRSQNTAPEGKIVVALVDGEATLKRYYSTEREGVYRLHAENDAYEDMYVEGLCIQGVAVSVIKKLQ